MYDKTRTADEIPVHSRYFQHDIHKAHGRIVSSRRISARDNTKMKTGINSGKYSKQGVSEIIALLVSNKMSTVIKLSDYDLMMTSEIQNIQKFLNAKKLKKLIKSFSAYTKFVFVSKIISLWNVL